MPSNRAAFVPEVGKPIEVKEAPYTPPEANDIVLKNHALAVNPVDSASAVRGPRLFPWLKFPIVLGGDVAGEVVEVGSAVTDFQVGDRVVGFAAGFGTSGTARFGFQEYTVLYANNATLLPDSITYERAVVLPLTLTTAINGLYEKTQLGLPLPSLHPEPSGKTLLIWGGATSVGCSTIQLAVASGFDVIATSSPANFPLLKRLGASQVFDYKDANIVENLVKAFEGKTSAGAFSIAGVDPKSRQDAADACYEVLSRTQGAKFVALAGHAPGPVPDGITSRFVAPGDYATQETIKFVFRNYLPGALAAGKFVPAPEPKVVGQGLESLQTALDMVLGGVTASKVVVTL
ncbi:GroES-like protein [Thozetella sp. PMI_491]|nr:GroES-like protein [Thozetella sp. PMI_491]